MRFIKCGLSATDPDHLVNVEHIAQVGFSTAGSGYQPEAHLVNGEIVPLADDYSTLSEAVEAAEALLSDSIVN